MESKEQKDQEKNEQNNLENSKKKIEIQKINIKDSILKFSSLHKVNKLWLQITLTILIALIFSFLGIFLIQNTGLYGLGVDALSHGVGRLLAFITLKSSNDKNLSRYIFIIFFWLTNLLINIPLFVFAYKKINSNFALLNIIFMIFSTLFGILLGFIPGSEHWTFFGSSTNKDLLNQSNNIIQSLFWEVSEDYGMYLIIFLYGLLWAIFQGIIAACLLILNSSTAGFDILVVWYSRKKIINLGYVYIGFHIICLFLANFIGTYLPTSMTANAPKQWDIKVFFNPNFVSSLLMILLNGFVVDLIFPKYKMVKIEIFTNKIEEITREIYSIENKRIQASILDTTGGYSKQRGKLLIIKCFYIDSSDIADIVLRNDPNAFMSIIEISKTFGNVYVSQIKK